MLQPSALSKDFAGHAQALALGDPSALAYGNSRSILSTLLLGSAYLQGNGQCGFVVEYVGNRVTDMLKIIEGLVQVDGGGGGFRVA